MKYYKMELLEILCDVHNYDDKDLINDYDLQWDTNCENYTAYFGSIKKYFSKSFLKIYYNNYGFHDYEIRDINYSFPLKKLQIKLVHHKYSYDILYTGVKEYNLNLSGKIEPFSTEFQWGYDEFEYLENGYLKHNILFEIYSEFEIIFKHISVKRTINEL